MDPLGWMARAALAVLVLVPQGKSAWVVAAIISGHGTLATSQPLRPSGSSGSGATTRKFMPPITVTS